ncbi:pyridoxine/pyridoxamine 5'-phosphate oxidase-like [Artemia franciscana]|uniref:pyridoxine/pyridoxamine 5'-phosphate oxidase-like n=1 Tax=Artemia franciscana TaxID=6661 RepID=UPI0032DA86D4
MTSNVDIKDMRQPYKHKNEAFLEEHLLSREPFKQFESWFNEACKCETIIEPNAICIATSTSTLRASDLQLAAKSVDFCCSFLLSFDFFY